MNKSKTPNIKTLNSRIRRVLGTFGDDGVYQNVMANLRTIEGLELTETGYISAKTKNEMSLKAALANIPTVNEILKETFMEDEDLDIDNLKMSDVPKSELIARSNLNAIIYGEYEASLTVLYNYEPSSDDLSAAAMDWYDIQAQLVHPGRKLTEEEVKHNKEVIQDYLKGLRR